MIARRHSNVLAAQRVSEREVDAVAVLSPGQRKALRRHLRALLAWQRSLRGFPRAPSLKLPAGAMPYVTIFAGGRLAGCFGSNEGTAWERLTRAFLRAMHDSRYAAVDAATRRELVATISYVVTSESVPPAEAAERIEAGTHGIALTDSRGIRVVLLPMVARERRFDGEAMLSAARRKLGGLSANDPDTLTSLLTVQTVAVGPWSFKVQPRESARAAAVRWLERGIDADGKVLFGVDARTGAQFDRGEFDVGRACVGLLALSRLHHRSARARTAVSRLTSMLRREVARGSSSELPREPHRVAGTLALALRAGCGVRGVLAAYAAERAVEIGRSPWHAAQVVAALGAATPSALVRALLLSSRTKPWAPWSLIAARALGKLEPWVHVVRALVASVRCSGPHAGGVIEPGAPTESIPQTAITALVVEALAGLDDAAVVPAVRLAREFVGRRQCLDADLYAPMSPRSAQGAFTLSPIHDELRYDVTGHAALALWD